MAYRPRHLDRWQFREIRERLDLTQKELADLLMVSDATIRAAEAGRFHDTSSTTRRREAKGEGPFVRGVLAAGLLLLKEVLEK